MAQKKKDSKMMGKIIKTAVSGDVYKRQAFSAYLPGCAECDFYEMELGTAGMMRGYMARRCDPYSVSYTHLDRVAGTDRR